MEVSVRGGMITNGRKSKVVPRIFHARAELKGNDSFCGNPHLYAVVWEDRQRMCVGVGDHDDTDIYFETSFTHAKIHETLNIFADYEGSYMDFNDAENFIETMKKYLDK